MRHLSLKYKICILIWALMLKYNGAEREHFLQATHLTWDGARNHCQVCFDDLVTLTPGNIQNVAQHLTSDSWIGLRKNFSLANYPSNTSMHWTRWANGDPLTFQNWYPGWPVFKSPAPQTRCCSCCTCAVPTTTPGMTSFTTHTEFTTPNVTDFSNLENTTDMSSFMSVTDEYSTNFTTTMAPSTTMAPMLPNEAECERSPSFPEPDDNYIEDSCVAMLSFGAWVEKNCSDLLPFICYEERFFGQVNVTNVTSSSAVLQWQDAPGNISGYRVEVKGNNEEMTAFWTSLTSDLFNLTAGTRYSIKVFPVKCGRDLNPQENSFYTIPNKVENLMVTNVTETSVFLSWDKPLGNVDFYLIKVPDTKTVNTESIEISGLSPGSPYTFTVLAGVKSLQSEESSISTYTRPLKVSDLSVSDNTNNSLLLSWRPPKRSDTYIRVQAMSDSNNNLFKTMVRSNSTETCQDIRVTGLPVGSKITLSVTALANGTVDGDTATVVNYTASASISNLTLETTNNSVRATWTPPGNYTSFIVLLQLDGQTLRTENLTESVIDFKGLKNAAKYTVIVHSVSGHLRSLPVNSSKFTLPSSPTNVRVTFSNATNMAFAWDAPDNTERPDYSVSLNSSFWNSSLTPPLCNGTEYMFENLTSGTHYMFQVQTVAGGERSQAVTTSHFTVADEREIILSMLCSASEPLLCAKDNTKESVFHQLYAHFNNSFGNSIFWKLERQEHQNTPAV